MMASQQGEAARVETQDGGFSTERLLSDLREANEKLILAAIESETLKDRAEAALFAAEQAARALRDSQRELLANAEFREQLLGIVGHDLRNPLSAIALSARLLLNHGQLSEADLRSARMIQKCVTRMDRMIAHVLDFTRIRVGSGLPIEAGPADLRPICEQAIAELALLPDVDIRSEFDGDLGGTWDEERLLQVLSNVLGNAVDHATPGTPVLVRGRDAGAEVVVEISNQGPAIPADLLPVLFAPFRSGRPSRHGHLGLGLFIAHEIARMHHGTLVASCSQGTTTFTLRLTRDPLRC
jgi:signal transduction histidine kinase